MSNDLGAVFTPSSFVGPFIVMQDGYVIRGSDVTAFGLESVELPFGIWGEEPAHHRPPTSGPVALLIHTASRLSASFKTYDDPADAAPDLIALGSFVATWSSPKASSCYRAALSETHRKASEEDRP